MQSYAPPGARFSFRLNCPSILRQYRSTVSSAVSVKSAASFTISSFVIQTNPGPPVQQFPHCWHVKRRPSAYQGSVVVEDGRTSSFTRGNFREGKRKKVKGKSDG